MEVITITEKECIDILSNCRDIITGRLKLIIWVGAGIDIEYPTCLPSGKQLTYFLLGNACPRHIVKRLEKLKIGKEKFAYLCKLYGESLRLESLIESFKDLEDNLKYKPKGIAHPFLNGFQSFWNAPANENHYWLSSLLAQGANIVTTNYDNCISKAYIAQQQSITGDTLSYDKYDEKNKGYYIFRSTKGLDKTGNIYYIHGIGKDIDTLGATLTQLKNGLSHKFKEQLHTWIEDKYVFLFLGYSGGDSLDVNPVFTSCKEMENTTGIYVRFDHEQSILTSKSEMREEEQLLLTPFTNKIVYCGDLKKLRKSFDFKMLDLERKGYEWDKVFMSNSMELNDRLRLILSIEQCFKLGLNAKQILPKTWWKEVKTYDEMKTWFIPFYGFSVGKLSRNKEIIRQFKPRDNASLNFKSDYWAALHDYKKAAFTFGTSEDIYKRIKLVINSNQKIEWEISTALNRYADYILVRLMHKPFLYKRSKKHLKSDIINIIRGYELILKHRNRVVEITQIYTALRFYGILIAIMYQDQSAIAHILSALKSYEKLSYMSGIIGTGSILLMYYALNLENLSNWDNLLRELRILKKMLKYMLLNRQFYYVYHLYWSIVFCIYKLFFN